MHTNIKYDTTSQEDKDRAYNDFVNWFGKSKSKMLQGYVEQGESNKSFHIACSIGGASGFPVEVFYKRHTPN